MTKAPFTWYGGKARHLDFILPLLPECKHFVDVFGGSACVLLAREPSPAETYNDIDLNVVNFFRVLRENKKELIDAIRYTPCSRYEHDLPLQEEGISDLEKARRFFACASTSYAGQYATTAWAYSKNESRRDMAANVAKYKTDIDTLDSISDRILKVQIECCDFADLIKRFDSPSTLFYCDPPYLPDVRGCGSCYKYEFSSADHIRLSRALSRIEGKAAVSGYNSETYEALYNGWQINIGKINRTCETKTPRQEVVWTNYDVKTGGRIQSIPSSQQSNILSYAEAAL